MKQRSRHGMDALLPVFVIVLVDLLGLTIIVPLLPMYAASFGASPFVIGMAGGDLSDHVSDRRAAAWASLRTGWGVSQC